MTKLLLVAALLIVGIPCILGFARWERQGKTLRPIVLLLSLELLEAAIYENEGLIPRGLFHPGSGSTQLRLPEIVITLALLGRLVAHGLPKRIGFPAMLWGAFAAWLTVALVEGYLHGNSHSQILYEGKAIIYVAGSFALASGVPLRRYIEAEVFERLTRWFAPLMLVIDVLSASHKSYALHVPLLKLSSFGVVGTDAATMFGAVGLIALMLELAKEKHNVWTIVCTVPMLISALLAGQRAALLGVAASVAVLLVVGILSLYRQRLRVHLAQVALVMLGLFALLLAVVILPAALGQNSPKIPFTSRVSTSFTSPGKVESAEDRVNELAAARKMISQNLILGQGLGLTYMYWTPGPNLEVTSALTEDIYTDLWVRAGLIGLGAFVLAALVSLGDGVSVWRRNPDRMVAIFAISLVAGILGILVKGGFESDFENYRIATLLGLLLGMLRSTATSVGSELPSHLVIRTARNEKEKV